MLHNLGAAQSGSSCCTLSIVNKSHNCINFIEEDSDYNFSRIAKYSLAGYQDIDFNDHSSLRH